MTSDPEVRAVWEDWMLESGRALGCPRIRSGWNGWGDGGAWCDGFYESGPPDYYDGPGGYGDGQGYDDGFDDDSGRNNRGSGGGEVGDGHSGHSDFFPSVWRRP